MSDFLRFKNLCSSVIYLSITKVIARPSGFEISSAVGNNLVDIAALTALIDSSAIESLTLGDKGFGGLAWAATSTFGALSVVKACIAGASASWLRETLGIRNSVADGALGMGLTLEKGRSGDEQARKGLGEALGISCNNGPVIAGAPNLPISKDIHAFDRSTMNVVNTVPSSRPGDSLTVYTFTDYKSLFDGSGISLDEKEWISILSSSPKLIEFYILWNEGAETLCWVGCAAWFYFFLAAIILWFNQQLWLSRVSNLGDGGIDIVTGHLPSAKRAGGGRQIILGASDNGRLSLLHRVVWGFGIVVCTAWLIATYILLKQYDNHIVFVWAGFQIAWLLLRLLFHHLADIKHPMSHRILPMPTAWENMDLTMKERTLRLTTALAQYQTHIHPRGSYSYKEEVFTAATLRSTFHEAQYILQPEFPLDKILTTKTTLEISVVAVIGDPILTSAAWMHGSSLNGMDLYDACIVLFNTDSSIIAVPSARVLSHRTPVAFSKPDIERTISPRFIPKSAPNNGRDITWWYWIPCGNGRWLRMHSDDMRFLGMRQAEVIDDAQLTKDLQVGNLNISLDKVEDVKQITALSMEAGQLLLQFFK